MLKAGVPDTRRRRWCARSYQSRGECVCCCFVCFLRCFCLFCCFCLGFVFGLCVRIEFFVLDFLDCIDKFCGINFLINKFEKEQKELKINWIEIKSILWCFDIWGNSSNCHNIRMTYLWRIDWYYHINKIFFFTLFLF